MDLKTFLNYKFKSVNLNNYFTWTIKLEMFGKSEISKQTMKLYQMVINSYEE